MAAKEKECEDSSPREFFSRDQLLFESSSSTVPPARSPSSISGPPLPSTSTRFSTSAHAVSCKSSSLQDQHQCSSTHHHPPGFPLRPSLLVFHSAAPCCTLQRPLQLHRVANTKLSPPLRLRCSEHSIFSPPLHSPLVTREVEPDHGAHVKRLMGLLKLRRQGNHRPPTPASTSCGSFNQAAAARELMMASLERLSMKEKTIGMNANSREVEVQQRALLAGEDEGEESMNAGLAITKNEPIKPRVELPLTAKIAAAMDAEGLIGVQEEITLQCQNYKSRALQRNVADQSLPAFASFKARPAGSAASSECEVRSASRAKMKCKRRRRWAIPRRVRSSRYLLGKLWMKLKRVFSSSSKQHLQNYVCKIGS